MIYYLYKITNNINGKFYIGVHSTYNEDDGYMGSGLYLKKAYKKYGIQNFIKEILFYYKSWEEMLKAEREIVNESLLKNKNCYNIALGGQSGIPNMVPVIDKEGNSFIVHKDDERFKNGSLRHNLKGTVPVLDEEGKYFRIDINDPDYINGKYKHNTKYLKWIIRDGVQLREHIDKIKESDILCRDSLYNTVVINKDGINKHIKRDTIKAWLNSGWKLGRINRKYIWIKRKNKEKYIEEINKEKYLTDGWVLGKIGTTINHIWVNDKIKNKLILVRDINECLFIGKLKEDKKYIHRNNEMKYVHILELDDYIKAGWVLGKKKIKRNMSHLVAVINKETKKIKRIDKIELDFYLTNGWKIGRKI